jgi:ABC-type uncharacterized transport system involved in gliding motility auxiliary subunit
MKNYWFILLAAVNIILYLVIVGIWIAIPQELILNIATTAFNLALTAVIMVVERERFRKIYQSGQFTHFTETFIRCLLIFFILGLLNYLAYKHFWQWDFSRDRLNSLTPESITAVQRMPGKLNFKIFSRRGSALAWEQLFQLYRTYKNDIQIEKIDIELRPDLAKEYEITNADMAVVEYEGRRAWIKTGEELSITNALIKASRPRNPLVYYVSGNKELDLEGSHQEGGSRLKMIITQGNFDLQYLKLSTISSIPPTVDAIIIWGPRQGFLPQEISLLDEYLKNGGRLMIALDPYFKGDLVENMRALLKKWGIDLGNNLVIDRIRFIQGSNGTVPMINKFQEHPITRSLEGEIFFPLVSRVAANDSGKSKDKAEHEGKFQSLAETLTFPASWADNNPEELVEQKMTFNPERDFKGPVPLAGVWESKDQLGERKARIAAFGNSTFVVNAYGAFPVNFLLFMNSLSWLTDDDLIGQFNLSLGQERPIFMNYHQMALIFWLSVLVVPILLWLTAVFFYVRRRRL